MQVQGIFPDWADIGVHLRRSEGGACMTVLWVSLGAAVLLFCWAGWRQKRYGGYAHYDMREHATGIYDPPETDASRKPPTD